MYERQIKTAKRLISKYGQDVIWKSNAVVRDAAKPWLSESQDAVPYNVKMVFLTINKENYETFFYMSDTSIVAGAVMGLMGSYDFTPAIGDWVERDGQIYDIETLDVLKPADKTILTTVVFKK